MKRNFKKILSAALAVLMLLTIVVPASAADVVEPGAGFDPGSDTPTTTSTSLKITFVSGDTYELTAKAGTTQLSDGSVRVSISSNSIVPEKKVPDAAGNDQYYEITGWAVKDASGNLVEIDLETYKFSRDTDVYAICEDTWPVYADMKQDRTDWFYQYVRDLSIAGVVNGYPGYIFKPQGNVTWGEALKLVMLATGYDVQAPTSAHWASGYLTTAKADALVAADKQINLDAPITRLEFAEVAAKSMKLSAVSIQTPFADTDAMAVLELYVAEIVEGSFDNQGNRLFKPNDSITRAELSAIIWRINNYEG